ncbi:MAG: hypothetical protein NTU81_01250 [Candidatus Nomurabacteria bacterium]|nr:hypothetical protein [Candidatus Nomurabacteria bacterium]
MKTDAINAQDIFYTNSKDETLSLEEIIDQRLIKEVTFSFLSKKTVEPDHEFSNGKCTSDEDQEEITVVIESHNNLELVLNTNLEVVVLKFASEKEWKKLPDDNYERATLKKQQIHSVDRPFHVTILLKNLLGIDFGD